MRAKEDTELKNNWEQENKHKVHREQHTSYCKNLWRSTLSGKKGMCMPNFIFHFALFLSSRNMNMKSNILQITIHTAYMTSTKCCLNSFFSFYYCMLSLKHICLITKLWKWFEIITATSFIELLMLAEYERRVENIFKPIMVFFCNCDSLDSSILYKILYNYGKWNGITWFSFNIK